MRDNFEQSDERVDRSLELMNRPRVDECVRIMEEIARLNSVRAKNDDTASRREDLQLIIDKFVAEVGDEQLALSAIFRKSASVALQGMIDVFSSSDYRKFTDAVIDGLDKKDGKERMGDDEVMRILMEVRVFTGWLSTLGYNCPSEGGLTKSPFIVGPFTDIDVFDPVWMQNLEVSENFHHAFYHLYDAFSIMITAPSICSGKEYHEGFELHLKHILEAVPGVINILRAFKSKLDGSFKKETVRVSEIVDPNKALLDMRFSHENELSRVPAEYNIPEDLEVNNVDGSALAVVLWEMQKNSLREGKVSQERLQAMLEAGEAYLTVSARETELDGKKVVVFEVRDKGAHIDLMSVIRKCGDMFFGYEARDFTLGEVLDQLSQRHLSIPLSSGGSMQTGIGLHSARSIVKEFNGEIFPANLEDGVGVLIVIPKEGAESDWNVSDLNVSGLQCAELVCHIAAYQEEVQNMIMELVAMVAVVGVVASRSSMNKLTEARY